MVDSINNTVNVPEGAKCRTMRITLNLRWHWPYGFGHEKPKVLQQAHMCIEDGSIDWVSVPAFLISWSRTMDKLTIEDVENAIERSAAHQGQPLVGVYQQLSDSMRENEQLRKALISARHILRVESLLDVWPENAKKIDEALLNKDSDNE